MQALYLRGSLQVFFNLPTGKIITLNVEHDDTIASVKQQLQDLHDTPADHARLTFAGKQPEGDRTLAHYKILRESTVHVVYRLRGC